MPKVCIQDANTVGIAYELLLWHAHLRGTLLQYPPLPKPSVCLVDAEKVGCGYSRELAGCSTQAMVYVAVRDPAWRHTLLHELYQQMRLNNILSAPNTEADCVVSSDYKAIMGASKEVLNGHSPGH